MLPLQYKLANSLTRYAVSLNDLRERKGNNNMSPYEAEETARDSLKESIELFTEVRSKVIVLVSQLLYLISSEPE